MLIPLTKSSDYEIFLSAKARKSFNRLLKKDKKIAEMIYKRILQIAEDPYDSDLMKWSFEGARKIRISDYRIIFELDNSSDPPSIEILKIGKRSTIYKR